MEDFKKICEEERDCIINFDLTSLEALTQKKSRWLDQLKARDIEPEDLKSIRAELKKTISLLNASRKGLMEAQTFLSGKRMGKQYTYSRSLTKKPSSAKSAFIKCL